MLIQKDKTIKENEYKVFSIKLLIIIGFVLILYFLYSIASFLYLLFFSIFLTLLFSPFLNKLNKHKIPDAIGIIIIYIALILLILIAIFSIIPILLTQTSMFINYLQNYVNDLAISYHTHGIDGLGLPKEVLAVSKKYLVNIDFNAIFQVLKDNFAGVSKFIASHIGDVASAGTNIITSIGLALFDFFMVLIMTLFIILERTQIKSFFYTIIPTNVSKYIETREGAIINSLYEWLKGQFLLSVSIFTLVYISLTVLSFFGIDLQNNFTLALISGLMEFVPYLGPILALIPALAIAISMGPTTFFVILILYIVIQQLENNLLVPYIMSKSLDLSPFLVLIMMTIGATLAGLVGIIVAIPLTAIMQIFVKDFIKYKKGK
ncbi:MAG: AI-2E family transporter [Candidatus Gracilibacteria bacterium]|nr:AI-2E family transporter [Candidatus Gracilibacteria bacterium]